MVHVFTDGRETPPRAGPRCSRRCRGGWTRPASAASAPVIGRYYAMDRDTRWDRTEKAVKLARQEEAEHEADFGEAAAKAAYERDETDEFITATKVGDEED